MPSTSKQAPVAIIGMACRFPGDAITPAAFWELLKSGQDAYSPTTDRFNVDSLWHPNARERLNVLATKGGHFLKQNPYAFDAAFFNITAEEANALDPKQRLALEVTYEALENAAQMGRISGSQTACYMGSSMSDYRDAVARDFGNSPKYHILGTCEEMIANRVSHFLNIHGPSVTVQTACSSSLVAIHLACQSLRTGDAEMALAGGVGMIMGPEGSTHLNNLGFLNPDGHCRSFDANPGGYARGEGCGVVMLKLLDKALEDEDYIRAVIRASGVNSDGWTQGVTMPSGDTQAALIRHVFETNGLDCADTQYCEAHGTGTKAGDLQEATALHRTVGQNRSPSHKLWVGSVKPNIGHLEAAAGVAGVIKGVLSLEHGQIPPNVHFATPNPQIPLEQWYMAIPTTLTPWPAVQSVRRMTVSGFGMGGTNGLVVLESFQDRKTKMVNGIRPKHRNERRLFVFSSSDQAGLGRLAETLNIHLRSQGIVASDRICLADLAHTLAIARSHLSWRATIIVESMTELSEALSSSELMDTATRAPASEPRIGFIFTGQGAHWAQMGIELLQRPVFKASVERSAEYLRALGCAWAPIEELRRNTSESRLSIPEISQPICAILQIALVDELRAWKVKPSKVAGHSSGELAAAYSIGALTHEDAVGAAYFRGKASASLTGRGGGMMAVGCDPDTAQQLTAGLKPPGGNVTIACVNSPSSVTLSGNISALRELQQAFEQAGIFARRLKVEVAYHSAHMESVKDDYLAMISNIEPASTAEADQHAVMISSVTGDEVDPELLGPYYWMRNLISPVLFADAVKNMVMPSDGKGRDLDMLIEIGPHSALRAPTEQILSYNKVENISYKSILTRGENAINTALQLAKDLYLSGVPIDLDKANGDADCKLLTGLPPYPWNHTKTFRADSRMHRELMAQKHPTRSLIGRQLPSMSETEFTWRSFIRLSEEPWLRGHAVGTTALFPGAGMVSVVLEAARQLVKPGYKAHAFRLRDVNFFAAMALSEDEATELIVHLRPHLIATSGSTPSTWMEFTVSSCVGVDQLRDNSRGLVAIDYEENQSQQMTIENEKLQAAQLAAYHRILGECPQVYSKEGFYQHMANASWNYGETFQGVERCRPGDGKSTFDVQLIDVGETFSKGQFHRPFLINPASLDAIFQTWLGATYKDGAFEFNKPFVPISIGELEIAADIPADAGLIIPGTCLADRYGFNELSANIVCFDENLSKVYLSVTEFRSSELDMEVNGRQDHDVDPADITSEVRWSAAVELLKPDDISKLVSNFPVDQRATELIRMLVHNVPSSSVIESIAHPDSLSKALTRRLPPGTLLQSRSHFVVPKTDPEEGDVDHQFDVLAGDGTTIVAPDQVKADILFASCEHEISSSFEDHIQELGRNLGDPAIVVAVTSTATSTLLSNSNQAWHKISDLPDGESLLLLLRSNQASEAAEPQAAKEVVIIRPLGSHAAIETFSKSLEKSFSGQGSHITSTAVWGEDITPDSVKGKTYVLLLELAQPWFHRLTEHDFHNLRTLILNCERLLWITRGDDPSYGLVDGFARCIRREVAGIQFQILHLSKARGLSDGPSLAGQVINSHCNDSEYRETDGILHVARFFKSAQQDESIRFHLEDSVAVTFLSDQNDALRLTIGKPGLLDSLRFVPDERTRALLQGHEMEIEVRATGLNFRDIMASMGLIPESRLGQEASGVVVNVGCEAASKFKVGDRVVATLSGAHANKIRSNYRLTAKIPASMTFEQAASVPVICNTAVYALTKVARLRSGQSVLIHAAAGGVGQAAIQLAKHMGLVVYATVGTDDKRRLLMDRYAISEDHIFHSRDTSFVKGVHRVTGGRGVDCVLNSLSGELLRASWTCLKAFGTFIELGLRDITDNMRLDMRPFRKGTSFTFVNLHTLHEQDPEMLYDVFRQTFELLEQGSFIPPYPVVTYSIDQVEEAFRVMQQGKHRGKIVLSFKPDAQVPVLRKAKDSLKLDPDATYLFVGGLGGLGRSLAREFESCGARNLAFISRSGAASAVGEAILQDFAARGVRAKAYSADVASLDSFSAVMDQCAKDLPPIKGVIQMAMVLRDVVFEKMSYEEWVEPLKPKVAGTWSLHHYFDHKRPLDFMLICSSCSGINGHPSQSSYAAGNTYQDALAHFRRSEGLHAISVNLGIMRDVGVLAETGTTGDFAKWEQVLGIREPAFHALMKSLIKQQLDSDYYPAQVCVGLGTADIMATHGLARPEYFDDPRFGPLAVASVASSSNDGGDSTASIAARLGQAGDLEQAKEIIVHALVHKIADILQIPASEVDASRPLYHYGVDSLVALEVRNWITREMQSNIALLEILAAVPIQSFAGKIAEQSKLVQIE